MLLAYFPASRRSIASRSPFPHRLRLLADGEPAERVAGKVQRRDLLRVADAQVLVEPTLDDPEQGAFASRILAEPGFLAPPCPPRRPAQRLLVIRARAL